MQIDYANLAFDLIEGFTIGGVVGMVSTIIYSALSALPGAIITSAEAGPLGLVTGSLIVIAVVVVQGRKRISA